MVGAELPRLLVDEGFADLLEQRVHRVEEIRARELAPARQALELGLGKAPLEGPPERGR